MIDENQKFRIAVEGSMEKISRLLVLLGPTLENLPNKVDTKEYKQAFDQLNAEVKVLNTAFTQYLEDNTDLHADLREAVDYLKAMKVATEGGSIKTHIEQENIVYKALWGPLLEEIRRVQDNYPDDDIKKVIKDVDLYKLYQYYGWKVKFHLFWKGWKARIAIIGGAIIFMLVLGGRLLEMLRLVLEHINNYPPPPPGTVG